MKRALFISTILFSAFSFSVAAQETQTSSSTTTTTTTTTNSNTNNNDDDDEPTAHFGVRGGINFSNFYNVGEDVTDQNVKLGYNIGLFAKAPLGGPLAIQAELFFISKGTSSFYENNIGLNPPGQGQLDFNLNYLELPVLAVINFNRYINIHGGVYGAYLTNANIRNRSENPNYNSYEELNRGDFNTFDYGLSAGIGLDLYPIVLGVRYDYGLRQIGSTDNARYVTSDSRNSCLQVYAGIGF